MPRLDFDRENHPRIRQTQTALYFIFVMAAVFFITWLIRGDMAY